MHQLRHLPMLLFLAFGTAYAATDGDLAKILSNAAPSADPKVVRLALSARRCAIERGFPPGQNLAVIDYSMPSSQQRLWVFNLESGTLEFREWVAHGRNSGDRLAHIFSNRLGSLASSVGLYRTLDAYVGKEGYALRLDGLEPGYNDHALDRAIVMHGAWYVSEQLATTTGRIGLSWGCPALRPAIARPVIDSLKGGQYLFAYYPDAQWLQSSSFLHCQGLDEQEAVLSDGTPLPDGGEVDREPRAGAGAMATVKGSR